MDSTAPLSKAVIELLSLPPQACSCVKGRALVSVRHAQVEQSPVMLVAKHF